MAGAVGDPGLVDRIAAKVVGRRRQLELVVAALAAGRHVLLEGPPGTGKSTLLSALAAGADVGFVFVEGSAELTPARLVGHYDPSRVLAEGYQDDVFVDGPLATALRSGSLLYVEEINRIPEDTLNVLVTVMSEGSITVPRRGRIDASPGFGLVAAMNPFDAVGTARISSAIYDRTCRVLMDYQSAADEVDIVGRATGEPDRDRLERTVDLVRRTRRHDDVRVGSSVRGAIDMVLVGRNLAAIRRRPVGDPTVGLDAALAALSGRIRLHESSGRTPEEVVTELYRSVFGAPDNKAEEPAGAEAPSPATDASPPPARGGREPGKAPAPTATPAAGA